jgi:hypothetical protein
MLFKHPWLKIDGMNYQSLQANASTNLVRFEHSQYPGTDARDSGIHHLRVSRFGLIAINDNAYVGILRGQLNGRDVADDMIATRLMNFTNLKRDGLHLGPARTTDRKHDAAPDGAEKHRTANLF